MKSCVRHGKEFMSCQRLIWVALVAQPWACKADFYYLGLPARTAPDMGLKSCPFIKTEAQRGCDVLEPKPVAPTLERSSINFPERPPSDVTASSYGLPVSSHRHDLGMRQAQHSTLAPLGWTLGQLSCPSFHILSNVHFNPISPG